jgi:hypothetical protein
VVAGDGGVGADDFFLHDGGGLRVSDGQGGGDRDVLADWETQDGGWCWELEAVAGALSGCALCEPLRRGSCLVC